MIFKYLFVMVAGLEPGTFPQTQPSPSTQDDYFHRLVITVLVELIHFFTLF